MGAIAGAVSPAAGERGARAGARGREKAVTAPPGGSGRYRPVVACIGGGSGARAGRGDGGVGRQRGERAAATAS